MAFHGRFLSIAPQHIRTARRTSPKGSERPDPTQNRHTRFESRQLRLLARWLNACAQIDQSGSIVENTIFRVARCVDGGNNND
jgi:hypothetical protein